jgi:hypothetical protein
MVLQDDGLCRGGYLEGLFGKSLLSAALGLLSGASERPRGRHLQYSWKV